MQALVNKYQEQGCRFLIGSSSGPSYLLVAEDAETGAQLGIKIECEGERFEGKRVMVVRARIRLAPDPSNPANDCPDKFVLSWEKSDSTRKSLMVAVALLRGPDDVWMVPHDLKAIKFAEQLRALIASAVPPQYLVVQGNVFDAFVADSVARVLVRYGVLNADAIDAKIADLKAQIEALEQQRDGKDDVTVTEVAHPAPTLLSTDQFTEKMYAAPKLSLASNAESDEDDEQEDDDGGDDEGN